MVRPRARAAHGTRFGAEAHRYDAVRPGYPADALSLLGREWTGLDVCDLGAGTGILSRRSARPRGAVVAVDPDEAALLRNPAPGRTGTAEDTGLPTASCDVITVAQAWHWFDEAAAAIEIGRILRPGGALILINQLDVRVDWVCG